MHEIPPLTRGVIDTGAEFLAEENRRLQNENRRLRDFVHKVSDLPIEGMRESVQEVLANR